MHWASMELSAKKLKYVVKWMKPIEMDLESPKSYRPLPSFRCYHDNIALFLSY